MERQLGELQWHWLYRDFLEAYAQCPADDLWIETYSQKHLRPHARLLNSLQKRIRKPLAFKRGMNGPLPLLSLNICAMLLI